MQTLVSVFFILNKIYANLPKLFSLHHLHLSSHSDLRLGTFKSSLQWQISRNTVFHHDHELLSISVQFLHKKE
jgi:hypothetical protein